MVYVQAARKTGAYMVLATVMSMGVLTFLAGDLEPTGHVIDAGIGTGISGGSWILFALGVFTGALLIGTYVYVAHIEAKRHE